MTYIGAKSFHEFKVDVRDALAKLETAHVKLGQDYTTIQNVSIGFGDNLFYPDNQKRKDRCLSLNS